MSKRRVYISGQMSGLDKDTIKRNFGFVEQSMKNYGYKVFNPARWGWFLRYLPYKWCLVFDLMMMCFCDGIFLQDNSRFSKGAQVEKKFALALDMFIITP